MTEFWSLAYKKNWVSKDQLRELVVDGKLQDIEYEEIVGEAYIPPT